MSVKRLPQRLKAYITTLMAAQFTPYLKSIARRAVSDKRRTTPKKPKGQIEKDRQARLSPAVHSSAGYKSTYDSGPVSLALKARPCSSRRSVVSPVADGVSSE